MSVFPDRVQETTTTTGTGTLNLGGAVTGFQTFVAGVGTGKTTYYCIGTVGSGEWEVGWGTVTDATPDTLSRTVVIASSNSNSLVTLSAGTKNVFVPNCAVQFPSVGVLGRPLNPDAEDEEFYAASTDSWQNQATATVTYLDDCEVFSVASGGTAGMHYLRKAITSPGSDYKYRARCWLGQTNTGGMGGGVFLQESGTSKVVHLALYRSGGAPNFGIFLARASNNTTLGATISQVTFAGFEQLLRPIVFEVERSGSTLYYRYSLGDGGAFTTITSEAVTASFTTQPDYFGRGVLDWGAAGGNTCTTAFSWVRRIS